MIHRIPSVEIGAHPWLRTALSIRKELWLRIFKDCWNCRCIGWQQVGREGWQFFHRMATVATGMFIYEAGPNFSKFDLGPGSSRTIAEWLQAKYNSLSGR